MIVTLPMVVMMNGWVALEGKWGLSECVAVSL